MVYIVDIQLRASTLHLVQKNIQELNRCVDGNSSCDGPGPDGMELFIRLLRNLIKSRLGRIPNDQMDNLTITTKDLFLEGQGSMQISDPPTEAQQHIIKSLTKVVLHQLYGMGSTSIDRYKVEEGQGNLLLSLFVERICCDLYKDGPISTCNITSVDSLAETIHEIISTSNRCLSNSIQRGNKLPLKVFEVHFFCCIEDLLGGSEFSTIVQEFDKINIARDNDEEEEEEEEKTEEEEEEENYIDGDTLTSARNSYFSTKHLYVSNHTLRQTKITLLPSKEYEGLWESLYFDNDLKQRLYGYATISLKIANITNNKKQNLYEPSLKTCNNKLLLLHGPPGTGKTSICKALCHKLGIRNNLSTGEAISDKNGRGILVEISCSELFSRWFGESSKNVATIFKDVERLLKSNAKRGAFVCLLIDEVEAIASSRNDLLNKNESTDSVRVVSTLLTNLDSLKKYNNLLVLATSNLLDSLDSAFVDRADGVFFIGNPSKQAVEHIIQTNLKELIFKGVLLTPDGSTDVFSNPKYHQILRQLAEKCATSNVSGRTLGKLPLICLSEHFREVPVHLNEFLVALAHFIATSKQR